MGFVSKVMAVCLTLGFFVTTVPLHHSAPAAWAQPQNSQLRTSLEEVFSERPDCKPKRLWRNEDCSTQMLWDSVAELDTPEEVTTAIVAYYALPKWSSRQEATVDTRLALLRGEITNKNHLAVRNHFLRNIVKYSTTDQMVLAMSDVMSHLVMTPSLLTSKNLVSVVRKSFLATKARSGYRDSMRRGFDSWTRVNKLADLSRYRETAILTR